MCSKVHVGTKHCVTNPPKKQGQGGSVRCEPSSRSGQSVATDESNKKERRSRVIRNHWENAGSMYRCAIRFRALSFPRPDLGPTDDAARIVGGAANSELK